MTRGGEMKPFARLDYAGRSEGKKKKKGWVCSELQPLAEALSLIERKGKKGN